MTTLLLIGFFMSVFLVALLLGKKNKLLVDKVLMAMFAVYALTIGGTYVELYNVHNNFPVPHLMNVNWLFLLLHGPLLWFYVKSLTLAGFKTRPAHLLHLIPFVFCSIALYFDFGQLSAAEKISVLEQETFTSNLFFKIGLLAVGVSSIGYNITALHLLRKHLRNLKNSFSNIEDKDLKWLKILVIASLVIFTLNVVLYNLNQLFPFAGYFELSGVAYAFSTFHVFYVGYFGIRQGRIFVDNDPIAADSIAVLADNDPIAAVAEAPVASPVLDHLVLVMQNEKPFLDPDLTLAKLSTMIQVKPDVLSSELNSKLSQNFFDFINKYRIEEFKTLCKSDDCRKLSILGIAFESGFNSKASFYRAFKKFEGVSPGDFMAKCINP